MNELNFLEVISQYDIPPSAYQYYHQLFDKRTIVFNEEVAESIVEDVYLPLKEFENDNNNEPVTLILNTAGGSVSDGLVLCSVIDSYKKKLNIILPSYACSMGTIILAAGNNNPNVTKRCYPFSFGLLHSGFTAIEGETATVIESLAFNQKIDDKIRDYIVSHTKISEEEYNNHYRKQWFLTSNELLELGFIDEIIGQESE